ncbi:MAG: ABC-2 family transporter protein [Oscillospiraceae bacterium]|jgi:ABC-2 type transport system permease protein|nr:ABC-2 family transporter protein [Oscillospiraceae bacterium]
MKLFGRLCLNNIKTSLAFSVDSAVGLLFSFAQVVFQALVWKGLYRGAPEVMGVALGDMLTYTVLSRLTIMLTDSGGIMFQINDSVQNGSIVERLTVPLGFKRYYTLNALAATPVDFVTRIIPVVAASALLFGVRIGANLMTVLAYLAATAFGFAIMTGYEFIMGLSVLWLKNSFFLQWMDGMISQLFTGYMVPMWFFPKWLETVGRFLPFRCVIFEPVSILMGKTAPEQIPLTLCVSAAWAVGLHAVASLIWSRGSKYLLINGG